MLKLIFSFILMALSTLAIGQSFLSNLLTREKVLKDFEHFKNALVQGHPALYWYADSLVLNQEFKEVES